MVPKFNQVDQSQFAKLQAIRQRCLLKSEAACWAAKRIRLLADHRSFAKEIEPRDIEFVKRAKQLADCFLWMCHITGPVPANPAQYEDVGSFFNALAEAIHLVEIILKKRGSEDHFKAALHLLVEAQSALRLSVEKIGGPVDSDQHEVYLCLRDFAAKKQFFIERYMCIDDPATESFKSILGRIDALKDQVQHQQKQESKKRKLLDKVRFKVKQVLADPKGTLEIWTSLIQSVVLLVQGGVPASNKELRDLLLPVMEFFPSQDYLPIEFELVMRELDQYTVASNVTDDLQFAAQPSREVAVVAQVLKGKSVVIIGGDRRPAAIEAIRNAFGLKEVVLVETNPHDSYEGFIPSVSRPNVALVLLAIRWASHSYKEVRKVCDDLGIPFVRLPGGMNPNQIAAQILAQASKRLGGS